MNEIASYMSVHHALKLTFGSACLCVAASVETGIRGTYDVFQLFAYKGQNSKEKNEKIKQNISANLGSALFYGLCAVNIVPGSAILGASIFTIYSYCVTDSKKSFKDEYVMSKLIGLPLRFVFDKVVVPVAKNVVWPFVEAISNIASKILSYITLPENPIWVASALLITTIAVTKFALPLVGITLI